MNPHPSSARELDPDLLECLQEVTDPEVGLSIVDLGLVYGAIRTQGAVRVAFTLTSRACPLGTLLLEETRERLAHRFQGTPCVDVQLVWDPPWSPAMITDRGRALLGRPPRNAT
jgi:metal-sulfur cluster biosynthetic enzyme